MPKRSNALAILVTYLAILVIYEDNLVTYLAILVTNIHVIYITYRNGVAEAPRFNY